ncbi:hypothetical protein BFC18_10575 [Alteromonas confluentis]|uniref:Diguanylate cyclase n=1 Tax=Alteromonas confluentis TaxID=1656094 RepID=A0A1E7ZBI7_9ALTE|nr:hypothetical protein BFC18_10575 [Alteromonas confluentis]
MKNLWHSFLPAKLHLICLFSFLQLCLITTSVKAVPVIKDPALRQFGTAQGLAQDSVRDIVRDKDGFIWVATEGGLSRWDGYRFVTVEGPEGAFVNNLISNLFVDDMNRLWISTDNQGVFYIDLKTDNYQKVLKVADFLEPDWVQSADAFEYLANGDMAIALDQVVVRYSPDKQTSTDIFRLSEQELSANEAIRDIKSIGNQLFVATTSRLYVTSLHDNGQTVKQLHYLNEQTRTRATQNAKVLYQYAADKLFVGTVGGLFSIDVDDFLTATDDEINVNTQLVLNNRNIWTVVPGIHGEFWLGTDRGLHRLEKIENEWQSEHILNPVSGSLELADKTIHAILPDELGNLWLGSNFGGLLFWYAKPLSIETFQNTIRDSKPALASNIVWSFLELGDDLWVGTENGLTRFNLKTQQSQHFLQVDEDDYLSPMQSINDIHPAGPNKLILEINNSLKQFSIDTGELTDMPLTTPLAEKVFSDWCFGSARDKQGRIYFLTHGFYRYDPATKRVEEIPLEEEGLSALHGGMFLDESAGYPGKVLLSLNDGIYQLDTQTLSIETVFALSDDMQKTLNFVSTYVVDTHGMLWLGFLNKGLIGLDAKTFKVKQALSSKNKLYSDIVYSLITDDAGDIWFASHGYFARYQPLSDTLERFRYGEQVRVSEFNEGAGIRLRDGRIALGSTTGFILFEPAKLSAETTTKTINIRKMVISGVSLDSRTITQPLRNFSGEHINFEHSDFGLTIQFSALSSSYMSDTKFRYKLVRGNTVVNESIIENGSVNFAFLAPGEYHFEVAPLKQNTDMLLLPASLSFSLPYPPLRSPVAFGVYTCLVLVLLSAYLFHRQRQLRRLQDVQHQVKLFGDAFQHTRDWVMIFDSQFVPVAVNPSCCAAFGIERNKGLERQLGRMFENSPRLGDKLKEKVTSLNAGEFWKSEERLTGADGRHYDVLVEVSVTGFGDAQNSHVDHYLIIMSDITEQKNAERKLIKIANYDGLTGLVNRTLLLEKLEEAIERAGKQRQEVGILFVDLDRFKGINDSLGHDYGDKLLRVVANRMLNLSSETDTVARLGGDEFVIVMENVSDKVAVGAFVRQLIESVETPIALGDEIVRVSASVGISFYPNDAREPAELLKHADVAMYSAKKDALTGFSYFTEEMNARVRERLVLENRVKKAYQEDGFYNQYQPIVNAKTGKTVGVELLLRCSLSDPPLYPSEFIPVLEELRYIIDVTRMAMKRAISDLRDWYADGFDGYVAINLSALHFKTDFDVDGVVDMLEKAGLPSKALRFELTEGILMDDAEGALRQVNRFIEAGFVLALDDFGTGYSSLSYLKKFPLQVLKIDKSFVDDIQMGSDGDTLVVATINMATSLNMGCVAEGVENREQVEYLLDKGCLLHQGYYYSRPVDAVMIPSLLMRQW